LGQGVYTPDDYTLVNPPLDDQPYAGVLYLDSKLYARRDRLGHTWSLMFGMTGPSSRAGDTQDWIHDWIGSDKPQGWDTQIPDEFLLNVGYQVDYLWLEGETGESARWRVVPTVDAQLGNWLTGVGGGLYGEIGWNLPKAFGGRVLREGYEASLTLGVGPQQGPASFSFFAGIGGYGIVHYLPLDGTVFKDSRSVDSNPFVGIATTGIVYRKGRLAASLSATIFTESFEGQRDNTAFGTFSVAWYF